MTKQLIKQTLVASIALMAVQSASAHITYTNRNFGTFLGDGSDAPVTIPGQTVSGNFGWADATDADFGDSHRTRAFRFKLLQEALVTLSVQGVVGATNATNFLPAFSIYAGLAHIAPSLADHDGTVISVAYLNSLGGVPKEGALVALGDWKIGNDDDLVNNIPASLSSLIYMGHAADGSAANYGPAVGINGDGIADNYVTGTFDLPAGDYSIFIGGADYSTQGPGPYSTYAITPTIKVVPEPSTVALIVISSLGLFGRRRRG